MRPQQENVVKKCEIEAKRLFELFLDVSDPKYQSKETNEGQFSFFFSINIIFSNISMQEASKKANKIIIFCSPS